MQLLLATTNPHKLEEIRAVFERLARETPDAPSIELVGLDALGIHIPEPEEDQPTFEGNAELKARYYAQATGRWCLAEDSGLEVDALGGEPGVRSARFAGVTGARTYVDPSNNALLLERLKGVPAEGRSARFVCAIALAAAVHSEASSRGPTILAVVRGTVHGRILGPDQPARGDNGFGYDPLFLLPERGRTTAELDPAEKNEISHRGRAARAMWKELVALASTSTS